MLATSAERQRAMNSFVRALTETVIDHLPAHSRRDPARPDLDRCSITVRSPTSLRPRSLQGGQIAEWVPNVSSAVGAHVGMDQALSLPARLAASRQERHLPLGQ